MWENALGVPQKKISPFGIQNQVTTPKISFVALKDILILHKPRPSQQLCLSFKLFAVSISGSVQNCENGLIEEIW